MSSERTEQNDVNLVIAPLIGFSKVVSETMANMQTSICQLLRIANAQEAEIVQLRKLVESILAREKMSKVANNSVVEEPIGVTLESVTRDADIMSQVDQHDELLKKMEIRKKVIMYPGKAPTPEQLAVYYAPGDVPITQLCCVPKDVQPLRDVTMSRPLVASKTQKELELEAARKAILDRARQHAATTYGTNVC